MSEHTFQPGRDEPYLTADQPGVGGEIKRYDADFVVEEQPLYAASGEGTHTYFVLEKQGCTTLDALQQIARALGRAPRDLGYAGLKDAHGITRQWVSIEHCDAARVAALELPQLRVLEVTRHTNKLKLGHLASNRFTIAIRTSHPEAEARAAAVLDVLQQRGVPNYFGTQRFGARLDNAAIGEAVLRGDYDEALALMLGRPGPDDRSQLRRARTLFDQGEYDEAARVWPGAFRDPARACAALAHGASAVQAWRCVQHSLRRLYVSAAQSALFNQVLAERLVERDAFDRLLTGDLAYLHRNGACFRVEDAAVEQPRCAAFEISPSGPIFGTRMKSPAGEAAEVEQRVLERAGLTFDQKRTRDGISVEGTRRALRVPLGEAGLEASADEHGPKLVLRFALPPGAYATNVTREICKA